MRLNYHHLRYFQEVALEGNLTRAAERLNLSQSALSTQIRQLEERLGHDLFDRSGRRMSLTEAGRIALDHAERIFGVGEDLIATLARSGGPVAPLRVGALSTLSRNFQLRFLRPVLGPGDTGGAGIVLSSGNTQTLLRALEDLALDLVLLTSPPPRESFPDLVSHRIADQPVAIHGAPARLRHGSLAELLTEEPMILPTESSIRTGFDSLVARLGITPKIAAVVDDMAMVRLLARDDLGLAITPAVVVADELEQGVLARAPFALDIVESFYAVVAPRSFPHPMLERLIPGGEPADQAADRAADHPGGPNK